MKSKLSVIFLGIAIFLMGAIAGAVSHYLYREHKRAEAVAKIPTYQNILDGMAKELMLDDDQKKNLRSIFDESRKRYFDLGLEYLPHYEKIRNETDDQIREMLRPDQKLLFEEFLRKVFTPPKPPPPK